MLTINNLSIGYSDKLVIRGIQQSIPSTGVFGVLGMNGAGKTTLFKSLYQMIPHTGEIWWNGQQLLKNQISFLETANYFYPFIKGEEYLQLIKLHNPTFDIDQWNQLFKLPLQDLVDTYSTGMKKKLAFMGILALDRPIMILDEPFNGVDFESTEILYQIILKLKQKGHLILISSHILESLTRLCDGVFYLNNGLFEESYTRVDFPKMEESLRALIHHKTSEMLEELF